MDSISEDKHMIVQYFRNAIYPEPGVNIVDQTLAYSFTTPDDPKHRFPLRQIEETFKSMEKTEYYEARIALTKI